METATVRLKYQIVIPSQVRKTLDIKPGQQFWVFSEGGMVRLVPKKDIRELFGTLKGIDSTIEREEEEWKGNY